MKLKARSERFAQPLDAITVGGKAVEMKKDAKEETEKGSEEGWGVGNGAGSKAFGRGRLENGSEYELITGEHPHSRRDNSHYARMKNGPVYAFNGHRPCVGIEIKAFNYLKDSYLSGAEIRKGGQAIITFDGTPVYSMFVRDPLAALDLVREKVHALLNHPANLGDTDRLKELEGRPIYYQGTPAFVMSTNLKEGSVTVRAADTCTFPIPVWARDDPEGSPPLEDQERVMQTVDILSPEIWWWRKVAEDGGAGTMTTTGLADGGARLPTQGIVDPNDKKRRKRMRMMESRVKHKCAIDDDRLDEEE